MGEINRGLLINSESGLIVPSMCEEISTYRHVRKLLRVPSGHPSDATLYLYVRRYPGHAGSLHVRVNNQEFLHTESGAQTHFHWVEMPIAAGVLRAGDNIIDVWADSQGQQAWSVGIEDGHRDPQSFLSNDRGSTWQNERMGRYHVQRGEYVVRLRIRGTEDNRVPPAFGWEDPRSRRLDELRALIPPRIVQYPDPWQRARSLASWVSLQWPYSNKGAVYAPWDPWTILSGSGGGPSHAPADVPIRMCVHYGVVFIAACLACGIAARPVVATSDVGGLDGHFAGEVWNERFHAWSLVDPNLDLAFLEGTRALGAGELFGRGAQLRKMAEVGPGAKFHEAHLGGFLERYLQGAPMMRLTGIWPRNDFLSHPELAPPCQGQHTYSETDIVWRNLNLELGELGMFPYIAGDSYFSTAPPAGWLADLQHTR